MISAYIIIKKESIRVPNKNFRMLGEKPLYRWCIDHLLEMSEISEVIINTDSVDSLRDLWDIPKLRIIPRRKELLGNNITANILIKSDLEDISSNDILMTHVTAPFVSKKTYANAIKMYKQSQKQSLMSVTRLQDRFFSHDKLPVNHDPDNLLPTQDLKPLFLENSCIYLFSKNKFRENSSRISEKPYFFETPSYESLDIDTPEDWIHAKLIVDRFDSDKASLTKDVNSFYL